MRDEIKYQPTTISPTESFMMVDEEEEEMVDEDRSWDDDCFFLEDKVINGPFWWEDEDGWWWDEEMVVVDDNGWLEREEVDVCLFNVWWYNCVWSSIKILSSSSPLFYIISSHPFLSLALKSIIIK